MLDLWSSPAFSRNVMISTHGCSKATTCAITPRKSHTTWLLINHVVLTLRMAHGTLVCLTAGCSMLVCNSGRLSLSAPSKEAGDAKGEVGDMHGFTSTRLDCNRGSNSVCYDSNTNAELDAVCRCCRCEFACFGQVQHLFAARVRERVIWLEHLSSSGP